MQAQRMSPGVVVGSVTASATTGALVAIGHRLGGAGVPFAAIGLVAFHRTAGNAIGLVIAGILIHVVTMFVWSFLCVWIAERLNERVIAAFGVAAANGLVSWIVALSTSAGLASALLFGDRLAFALVLAIALAIGMRYALPSSRMP